MSGVVTYLAVGLELKQDVAVGPCGQKSLLLSSVGPPGAYMDIYISLHDCGNICLNNDAASRKT